MTANVETMAYAGETPWHGLGEKVSHSLSPEEMLKAAKLNWEVEKRKIRVVDGKTIPGKFALVRTSDDSYIDVVGATYKPVQNREAFEFFKKFTTAGHMKMETAGSLCGGQYIWALAKVGLHFNLGTKAKPDDVMSYVLLMSPHKFGKSLIIQHTAVRVVCWNTLNFALGSSLKGDASAFRMPHVREFDEAVRSRAEEALGLVTEQWSEIEEDSKLLTQVSVDREVSDQYFMEVLEINEEDLAAAEAEGRRTSQVLKKFRAALEYAPGAQLEQGTLWSALNAVTFVVDHQMGRDRNTALRSAWLGGKSRLKKKAFDTAVQYAKEAA